MDRILYHGSSKVIERPDISFSREDIDFGKGFYLTADQQMAKKWACSQQDSVLNTYRVCMDQLHVRELSLDEEWLEYVIANRTGEGDIYRGSGYDVIIGATADDKLFTIIDLYTDGLISPENAIKVMKCMNYSDQVVFKNQAALDAAVTHISAKSLHGQEKELFKRRFQADSREAAEKTREMLRNINRRKGR